MNLKTLTFLKLSDITSRISVYFWHKHVKELRKQQYEQGLRP
jgi:hypothetical protein|tara:strand:+ start:300 stop:425 length:126 start_codon:yes stop_codon:yes gene_type:complete